MSTQQQQQPELNQPEQQQQQPPSDPSTLVGEAHQRLIDQQQQLQQQQQYQPTTDTTRIDQQLLTAPPPIEQTAIEQAGLEGAELSHITPEELARQSKTKSSEEEREEKEIRQHARQQQQPSYQPYQPNPKVVPTRRERVPVPGGVREEFSGRVEPETKRVHVVEQRPGEAIVIKPKPSYFYQATYLPWQRVGEQTPIVRDATIDMFNSLVAKNTHCLLGRTGIKVSRITLGTMNFGRIDPQYGDRPGQLEEAEAHRLLDRYVELGGNCIDTADFFPWFGTSGESENIVGSWLENQERDRLFLITKCRMPVDPANINSGGLSRGHLIDSVRRSLKRLRTDYVDMLMLNGWDPTVSVHETVRHLNDLVEAGLVRYIGVCDFKGWQLQKFIDAARMMNMHKCVCYMGEYNLLTRGLEWEVVDVCRNERIGFFAYAPFKYGFLSKFYTPESTEPIEGTRIQTASEMPNLVSMAGEFEEMRSNPIYEALLNVCQTIGRRRNLTTSQIAILWALQRGFVTSCVLGASTVQELDENMSMLSGDVLLTGEELLELDQASRFRMHYPYTLNLSSLAGYKEIDPRNAVSFEQLSFVNEYVPFEQMEQMRLSGRETFHESSWQAFPERQKFGEPSIQQQQQPMYEEKISGVSPLSPLQEQQRIGLLHSPEQTLQSGKEPKQAMATQIKAQAAQFPPQAPSQQARS